MNRELLSEIINYKGEGERLALATVVETKGSSPRSAGAQMLVYPDGSISGTIGGGPNEAKTIAEARQLIKEGGVKKCCFELTNEEIAEAGGICGGNVDVFIETINVK